LPAAAGAYSWPLRPFNQQHAVRGYFNDPRLSGAARSFHFGIDIVAGDLEPVYAVQPGRANVRTHSVSITWRPGVRLSYTHILPAVRNRQLVRRHQVVGWVIPGAEHLHFAEFRRGTHVNPLRMGALAPWIDDTVPQIPTLSFYIGGSPLQPELVTGLVDVAVDAFDAPPLPLLPAPWAQARLAPALLRWRIVRNQETIRPWQSAIDFRYFLIPSGFFEFVYTPGTYQNRPNRPGRYQFYLARGFDTRTLPNGPYTLEVEAWDTQQNIGRASFPFTVTNV
jgi:murein DD-endopeptidase MepM/ murein hydrolase activator NlpD